MIDGKDIVGAWTLKSMYDGNCIAIKTTNEVYRISADTILAMINDYSFDTNKKRTHTYLVDPVYQPSK